MSKPWGSELVWAEAPGYTGKFLFVESGQRLSLQLHEFKDETIFLAKGEALLEMGDPDKYEKNPDSLLHAYLTAGAVVRLKPRTLHRIKALQDCVFLEAASTAAGVGEDVVRFDDDYGRPTVKP